MTVPIDCLPLYPAGAASRTTDPNLTGAGKLKIRLPFAIIYFFWFAR